MTETNTSEINVNEIMKKIREEVAKRKADAQQFNKQDKVYTQSSNEQLIKT